MLPSIVEWHIFVCVIAGCHCSAVSQWCVPGLTDLFFRGQQMYSTEIASFMTKVFDKSGLSPEGTFLPAHIHPSCTKDPKYDLDASKAEVRMLHGTECDSRHVWHCKPFVVTTGRFPAACLVAGALIRRQKDGLEASNGRGSGCRGRVVGVLPALLLISA